MDSTLLFQEVPTTVGGVLRTVWQIFAAHGKTFVMLALAQVGAFIVAGLILLFVTFLAAAAFVTAIFSIISNLQGAEGGYTRHLLDYSTGVSGSSRLLNRMTDYYGNYYSNNYDNNYYNTDDLPDFYSTGFIVTFIVLYILFVVVLSIVSSIFKGAFTHALAEIYAGAVPSVKKSITHGMGKMCSLFSYCILFSLMFIAVALVTLGTTVVPAIAKYVQGEALNPGLIFIGILLFFVAVALLVAVTVAAVPSIVVEGKSATQSIKRSWSLCKDYVCFILCCCFSLNIILFLATIPINIILNALPDSITFIGQSIVNILKASIAPILGFVLYMSVRIRAEDVTQEQIANEIDSNVPLVHAVELKVESRDGKAVYENLTTSEVV